MPTVKFTKNLAQIFPEIQDAHVPGSTVAEIVAGVERLHPRLSAYLVDERGALRRHVNIFIGNEQIADRVRLQDPVSDEDVIHIFQALSGG